MGRRTRSAGATHVAIFHGRIFVIWPSSARCSGRRSTPSTASSFTLTQCVRLETLLCLGPLTSSDRGSTRLSPADLDVHDLLSAYGACDGAVARRERARVGAVRAVRADPRDFL